MYASIVQLLFCYCYHYYADDLFLMTDNCGVHENIQEMGEAFMSYSLKADLPKTRMIISCGIRKDVLYIIRVYS